MAKHSEDLARRYKETTDNLMAKMSALENQIESIRQKEGSDTSGDLKDQVNKMAKEFSETVALAQDNRNKDIVRLEEVEKELQDYRQKKFKWDNTASMLNPYSDVYKHLYRENDEALKNPTKATVDQTIAAINAYGKQVPHKSDLKSLLFPQRKENVKALLTALSTDASGSAGATLTPEYMEQILAPAQEYRTLLDEFPMITTNSTKMIWRQEKLSRRRGSAGVTTQSLDFTGTGQGTTGTEIEFQFEQHEEEMRTFLGLAYASVQILQDTPYMSSYVGNQMQYEGKRKLSNSLLYGTNKVGSTGDQARQTNSINAASTDLDLALLRNVVDGSTHHIDVLKSAWLQATLTFIDPTIHLMHPTDYTSMLLKKDSDGAYLFVPNINNPDMLSPLGMPVAKSTYINQGTFFTVPANEVLICMRKGWESTMSFEDSTNIRELEVTFRVYGRFGIIFFRPSSMINGNFSTAFSA